MTTLDIHSIVFAMPHRRPENPLPPLHVLGDLHDDVDGTGLDEEMARNLRYGHVSSVLPYLLQDDYSRELVPRETTVAILEPVTPLADATVYWCPLVDPWCLWPSAPAAIRVPPR
jgi:hypothetical protein